MKKANDRREASLGSGSVKRKFFLGRAGKKKWSEDVGAGWIIGNKKVGEFRSGKVTF